MCAIADLDIPDISWHLSIFIARESNVFSRVCLFMGDSHVTITHGVLDLTVGTSERYTSYWNTFLLLLKSYPTL